MKKKIIFKVFRAHIVNDEDDTTKIYKVAFVSIQNMNKQTTQYVHCRKNGTITAIQNIKFFHI